MSVFEARGVSHRGWASVPARTDPQTATNTTIRQLRNLGYDVTTTPVAA